ncbi:uroporphyrinogen-III synthase [Starkeya koreensis]|uniref:Uroporphyrinogen-III synthase n=1 Tax=Ancylobacter koreensis TaxID=266121 RepID=A0ABT0DM92_9HYPH|nr:uroporphyrinogen-III synthase [Ancylobacter koreensis]MCK0208247.1 uroporphyrinogen-III synthase [Ancylobacter koreensis]
MRVLVTRPQPDAQATAARLAAAGHQSIVDPMLAVEAIADARLPDGRFDAVVLTSVNGARLLGRRSEFEAIGALPLYTVGHRTAAAADHSGPMHIAGGNGAALVGLLRATLPRGARLLHVAGEERAVDLGAALAGDGIHTELFVIYRTVPARALAAATLAAAAAGAIDAAFHFSPRTAATLAARASAAGASAHFRHIRHLCFSANVAAPLAAEGWRTEVAAAPTEEALFALIAR